jgi:hypothetical protein
VADGGADGGAAVGAAPAGGEATGELDEARGGGGIAGGNPGAATDEPAGGGTLCGELGADDALDDAGDGDGDGDDDAGDGSDERPRAGVAAGAGGGDNTMVGSRSLLGSLARCAGSVTAGWVRGTLGNAPARVGVRGSGVDAGSGASSEPAAVGAEPEG